MSDTPQQAAVPIDLSEGGPTRKLSGGIAWLVAILAFVLAALALYWTQYSIGTTSYRALFLGLVLTLAFLVYPAMPWRADRDRVQIIDWLLALAAIAALYHLVANFDELKNQAAQPHAPEVVFGAVLIICVLEATRRTIGWVLPVITIVFLVYALAGPYMPEPLDHRGYSIARIVGQNYLMLEGIFSTPLDVAATFIILFTVYGAVLDKSGAGKFFIDWSFALFGKRASAAAPGRAIVASGFLLGTVSGSGVATTVTLATLGWPMLKRSGYPAHVAGGMFAASGIGALLSPPTLGAAAFIIAEYLKVTYFDVLVMATVPTLLYYLSCALMVEADARRLGVKPVKTSEESLGALTWAHGYHFLSLGAIAVLLAWGFSSFMAVFWSIAVAFALSMIRTDTRLATLPAAIIGVAAALVALLFVDRVSEAVFWGLVVACVVSALQWGWSRRADLPGDPASSRFAEALFDGGRSVVAIAATCACAGIIVSVISLTGLGLRISDLIVQLGGGSVFFTVVFAAIAMWILGTAVPVTASYIIAAVTLAPALTSKEIGIPDAAAHMFLFYYAVLADVSPPTALAPFAASAITNSQPFPTMMQAWKYCLPAFLVPFMFCLTPEGKGLLLQGAPLDITVTIISSCIAVAALAAAFGGWIVRAANLFERLIAGAAGLALLYANAGYDVVGLLILALALAIHAYRIGSSPQLST